MSPLSFFATPSSPAETPVDGRQHVRSMLMRESLLDKRVMSSTETPVVAMLPFCRVIKVGGRSIVDRGKSATYPLVDAIVAALDKFKLVIATGGGIRSRHVTSIGMDLGLPTGVLAQLRIIDALGNAHLLGTLLAQHGVVAIPPEILGHMLPFFIKAADRKSTRLNSSHRCNSYAVFCLKNKNIFGHDRAVGSLQPAHRLVRVDAYAQSGAGRPRGGQRARVTGAQGEQPGTCGADRPACG